MILGLFQTGKRIKMRKKKKNQVCGGKMERENRVGKGTQGSQVRTETHIERVEIDRVEWEVKELQRNVFVMSQQQPSLIQS